MTIDYKIHRQPYWDMFYLGLAKYYSAASKDPSTKVGAVIVRPDNKPVSWGYNGFPRGMDDDPALYADRDKKNPRIIHAEMNALLLSPGSLQSHTIYVWPFMSCKNCVLHIIQAGITRIVSPECPEHLKERWGESFAVSREYCAEAGVIVDEYTTEECAGLPEGPHREP